MRLWILFSVTDFEPSYWIVRWTTMRLRCLHWILRVSMCNLFQFDFLNSKRFEMQQWRTSTIRDGEGLVHGSFGQFNQQSYCYLSKIAPRNTFISEEKWSFSFVVLSLSQKLFERNVKPRNLIWNRTEIWLYGSSIKQLIHKLNFKTRIRFLTYEMHLHVEAVHCLTSQNTWAAQHVTYRRPYRRS